MGMLDTRMAADKILVAVNKDDSTNVVASDGNDGTTPFRPRKDSSRRGFFLAGGEFMFFLSRTVSGIKVGCSCGFGC